MIRTLLVSDTQPVGLRHLGQAHFLVTIRGDFEPKTLLRTTAPFDAVIYERPSDTLNLAQRDAIDAVLRPVAEDFSDAA